MATAENAITAIPTPRLSTSTADTSRRVASKTMIPAPTRISIPSIVAARFSTFSWPYGWSSSGGTSARRTETSATTDASRSIDEWIASVRIAIDPVIAPAASFSAIRIEFETTESIAAPALVRIIAAAPRASARARAARPRWLIACFSAGLNSAIVLGSAGPVSTGTNAGS